MNIDRYPLKNKITLPKYFFQGDRSLLDKIVTDILPAYHAAFLEHAPPGSQGGHSIMLAQK